MRDVKLGGKPKTEAHSGAPALARPLVLLFQGSFSKSNRDSHEGVFRYASESGWTVQTVCFAAAAASRFDSELSSSDIRSIVEFWRPDGCIVDCAGRPFGAVSEVFGKTPVVFLDCAPSESGRRSVCVSSDSKSVAAAAAKELLSMGYSDYAYLPHSHAVAWSRERGEEFERLVRLHRRSFYAFRATSPDIDSVTLHKELVRWAQELPHPCGIFAANDRFAEMMLRACIAAGVQVPDDMAVVGVDDDEQICENTQPSLSSVRIDSERAGYLAAELLSRRFSSGARRCVQSASFGAAGVHRRASTRHPGIGDPRVRCAVEFIRRHVCEGTKVPDVVREMGCSRRLADLRFREGLGHSILDEIQSVRVEEVKRLLCSPRQHISAIVDICGYASLSVMCREFRRWTGTSMREWRRSQSC